MAWPLACSPPRLGAITALFSLVTLSACTRTPLAGETDGVDSSELPDDANLDPSCGDGISQPGEFCLYLASSPNAGIDPCDIDTTDFNHDGLPDLAVPNSDPNISNNAYVANVMLGDGEQVAEARAYAAGGALPIRSAVGDFNGDGHPDFAVANQTVQQVNILLGDGTGDFTRAAPVDCDSLPGDLVGADIDGDGRDELIVNYASEGRVDILFGGGGEHREGIDLIGQTLDVEAADFDGDGRAELILPLDEGQFGNSIRVYSRADSGSYVERSRVITMQTASSVKAGDLDSDGDLDLVSVSMMGEISVHHFHNGALTYVGTQQVGGAFTDVAISDFDANTDSDLAIADVQTNHVRFFRRGADGRYDEFAERFTGSYPIALVSADFNLDGQPDLATADQFSNRLSVFLSAP